MYEIPSAVQYLNVQFCQTPVYDIVSGFFVTYWETFCLTLQTKNNNTCQTSGKRSDANGSRHFISFVNKIKRTPNDNTRSELRTIRILAKMT